MFVLSSDYEGMPNVVIEAMAMGMPVIATDCPTGGPAALIKHSENGMLVPVGDVDKLCQAMQRIAVDKEYADRMGQKVLEIRNRLNSDIIAEQLREYLTKCCSS